MARIKDYLDFYEEMMRHWYAGNQCPEHSDEYEGLTMEEKLLVDADMEYLKDETNIRYISHISRYILEKCLSKLRKRDRKNGKRNGR